VLSPRTAAETRCSLSGGLRDSFPHQQAAAILTSSEVVVTMSKERLLCGILVWGKKWQDANTDKGENRKPKEPLVFLPL